VGIFNYQLFVHEVTQIHKVATHL